ncbi:SDR family oxidoreductase [Clostridium felsineum]|uniref:type I polyketide synthase n=1 Tax=Clostridium felsineum TaxID=36839 RepID=UPI00214D51B2|nr:type I polyketide synthase [Clostridium felsineum]MCR3759919.1 SDR family oxidoreductase [Clostridium felsineum]
MKSVRKYILRQVAEGELSQGEAKKMLLEIKTKSRTNEDIAIVGVACRFPLAENKSMYWDNLVDGVNCIIDFPMQRRKDYNDFLKNPYYTKFLLNMPSDKLNLNDIYSKGGYLKEIDKFDAKFFKIPPKEAKYMDPQQRIFLETAYEAIEDSGYGPNGIFGTKTGVFVGKDHTSNSPYKHLTVPDPMSVTGSWNSILASRVSYIYNLKGPSVVIDTACSSSLTAVHMACEAIKNSECDMAIAGGIHITYAVVKGKSDEGKTVDRIDSKSNKIKAFDKEADGTIEGEGVGVVILKPLKKAVKDRDNIYAVIKGSGINNDGASNGITAPSAEAQEDIITSVWKSNNINPETISYVEAHGTGTELGDPIEIKGLTNAFKKFTSKKQFCAIGSVKSNIGHTVGAAGVASLIKVVLSLKNKIIPKTINFNSPNPYISFKDSPLYVVDKSEEWIENTAPRRAAINSFGFSGTNCHMVVEEYIKKENIEDESNCNVFTLSSKTKNGLRRLIKSYNSFFVREGYMNIGDICYTSNMGRGHYEYRLAIIVKNYNDLLDKMTYLDNINLSKIDAEDIYFGKHKVISNIKSSKNIYEISEKEKLDLDSRVEKFTNNIVEELSREEIIKICRLYVKGAEVEWKILYNGRNRHKVTLPSYEFENKRFWADLVVAENYEYKLQNDDVFLLGKCIAKTDECDIFEAKYNIDKYWFIKEHKLNGYCIVPGTAYIEIARLIANEYYKGINIAIQEITFNSPLILNDFEEKKIQVIVKKQNDYLEFKICSYEKDDYIYNQNSCIINVQGKIFKTMKNKEKVDVISILKEYEKLESEGIKNVEGEVEFGPRWQSLKNIYKKDNNVLLELELPEEFASDFEYYKIHPALVDCSGVYSFPKLVQGVFLPLSYKTISICGDITQTIYSHVVLRENSDVVASFDINIYNDKFEKVVDIKSYTIKKVNIEAIGKSNRNLVTDYFKVDWIAEELGEVKGFSKNETVVVFKDRYSLGNNIISKFKDMKIDVVEIDINNNFAIIDDNIREYDLKNGYVELFRDIKNKRIKNIIHLSSINKFRVRDVEGLAKIQDIGVYSLYYITKALVENKINSEINISIISNSTNEVTKLENELHPESATLLGLGKVVPAEYEKLKCRFIDIDEKTKVDIILREIRAESSLYCVAYRDDIRYVQQFSTDEFQSQGNNSINLSYDGVYILTGGTGALALEIAEHISSKEKINLALISRSKFPEENQWEEVLQDNNDKKLCEKINKIKKIKEKANDLIIRSVDIANKQELSEFLDNIRNRYGKINGIIHCAGIAGDGFIINREKSKFNEVIAPKVYGTFLLDQLTKSDNLEFVVMFSSIASIIGGMGQGDYAAANSYLDCFANYRNKSGKKTIVINWTAWKEIGMSVDYNIEYSKSLFNPILNKDAILAFDHIISNNRSGLIVGSVKFELLKHNVNNLPFKLSNKIKIKLENNKKELKKEASVNKKVAIKGKDDFNEVESRIAAIWAEVMELDEIDVYESFNNLGGDSIIATIILKKIEVEYPGIIDISDIFRYPSVIQISDYINSKINKQDNNVVKFQEIEKEYENDELMNLIKGLKTGNASVNEALKILSEDNGGDEDE